MKYNTLEAENGAQALTLLGDYQIAKDIDIILSDLVMPKIDGLELLKQCRIRGIFQPVIFLTGNASKKSLHQALRIGAFDYIQKPFITEDIDLLLHSALSESLRLKQEHKLAILNSSHSSETSSPLGFEEIDFSDHSLLEFIEHSKNHITFALAAAESLLKQSESQKTHLSFLFRIAREITHKALAIGLFDIADFTTHLMECLIFYRTNNQLLKRDEICLLQQAIQELMQQIENVATSRSIYRIRIYQLKKRLYSQSNLD